MKKILIYSTLLILFGIAIVGYFLRLPEQSSKAMGTGVTVKGENASLAVAEIKRLDDLLSQFNPSSEVSQINQNAGKHPVLVSEDTYNAINQAYQMSELSKGAFDVTLGKGGSYRDIILDRGRKRVYLRKAGMKIDLGGIGKGYAVESARRILQEKGTKKALIDLRSSIAVIGGSWKIGIFDPRNHQNEILGAVNLNDGDALSTSGQYEQTGHIIDPRVGKVADKCLSVTIIAKDAGLADALSTAVFVLGPVDGMKLVKSLSDVKVVIVDNKGIIYDNFGFKLR